MAASLPTPPIAISLFPASKTPTGRGITAIPASSRRASGDVVEEALLATASDAKKPWCAPLFQTRKGGGSETQGWRKRAGLTAEKARLLRKELPATECWHDVMYYSVIAARLASPDEKR